MASRFFRHSLLVGLVVAGCECGEDPPPDDVFDGNVIVGDGPVAKDGGRDSAVDADLLDGATDSGTPDGGTADAALDAGPQDGGTICDEMPVATLSATAAAAELDTYEGMVVAVTGTATQGETICTEMACPPDSPCCNTCTATVSIQGVLPLRDSACFTPGPGCSGTECGQVCRPPIIGLPQRFVGRLVNRSGAGLELHSVTE